MKHVSFLLSAIVLLLAWQLVAQKSHRGNGAWQQPYSRAKQLFALDNPTEASDSIALALFLSVAEDAAANRIDTIAADAYIKAGTIHQTYQRYADANLFYRRAIAICRRTQNAPGLLYEASLYIGTSFYYTSVIDSARHYFEAASDIALGNKTLNLSEKERLYNSLGAIYFESADYMQSKNYFEKALSSILPTDKEYRESYVSIKSNIANCLLELDRPGEALDIYRRLGQVRLSGGQGDQQELARTIQHNMAHAYFRLQQYDSALLRYGRIEITPEMRTVKMLNDLGRIHIHRRNWQQAEALFDSAVALSKRIVGNTRNKDRALSYSYRSMLAERQGLLDEAIA
jgi:tetratricopeptide (TPR) repeat protein